MARAIERPQAASVEVSMSYESQSRCLLVSLGLLVAACASGEAVTPTYGEGPNGTEKPPVSQQGESTPVPNLVGCNDIDASAEAGSFSACGNACLQCIADVDDEDSVETLACIYGAACQAYIAQFVDLVGDDGLDVDDNILLEPDAPPPEQGNDCEDLTDDPCGLCLCEEGELAACVDECSAEG